MDISKRIRKKIEEFYGLHEAYPRNIYLGRDEMKQLQRWAFLNGYSSSPESGTEGEDRPEFSGKACFEVNDEIHLEVA